MFKNTNKTIKKIFYVFIALFIFVIIAFVITNISRIGKYAVSVHFAPFNAELKLDTGQRLKNDATNYIAPGTYELSIVCDHFESQSQTITIDETTEYLLGKLVSLDEVGVEINATRNKDFLKVEALAGKLANQEGAKLREKHPILNYLPINNSLYSISFTYNEQFEPQINIKATPKYQDIAVQKLYTLKDIDPSDYDISFTDLKNPYSNPTSNNQKDPIKFIKSSFPSLNFEIKSLGEIESYYLASIYTYDFNSDISFAHYRIILKNNTGSWHFAAPIAPLLTTKNSPDIPKHLLNKVNIIN